MKTDKMTIATVLEQSTKDTFLSALAKYELYDLKSMKLTENSKCYINILAKLSPEKQTELISTSGFSEQLTEKIIEENDLPAVLRDIPEEILIHFANLPPISKAILELCRKDNDSLKINDRPYDKIDIKDFMSSDLMVRAFHKCILIGKYSFWKNMSNRLNIMNPEQIARILAHPLLQSEEFLKKDFFKLLKTIRREMLDKCMENDEFIQMLCKSIRYPSHLIALREALNPLSFLKLIDNSAFSLEKLNFKISTHMWFMFCNFLIDPLAIEKLNPTENINAIKEAEGLNSLYQMIRLATVTNTKSREYNLLLEFKRNGLVNNNDFILDAHEFLDAKEIMDFLGAIDLSLWPKVTSLPNFDEVFIFDTKIPHQSFVEYPPEKLKALIMLPQGLKQAGFFIEAAELILVERLDLDFLDFIDSPAARPDLLRVINDEYIANCKEGMFSTTGFQSRKLEVLSRSKFFDSINPRIFDSAKILFTFLNRISRMNQIAFITEIESVKLLYIKFISENSASGIFNILTEALKNAPSNIAREEQLLEATKKGYEQQEARISDSFSPYTLLTNIISPPEKNRPFLDFLESRSQARANECLQGDNQKAIGPTI